MTEADCVHSTPPINTSAINPARPVDPTRRGFITLAAGASIISVGSLASVAMPISSTPVSDAPIDPIYDAIEAHRKAYATMQAVFAEHRQAHELADAKVGPALIYIPSMVDPGNTVEASCWVDIGRAIPQEQYPDLYSHHNRLLDEQRAAHAAVVESLIGDEDEATGEVCGPELGARDAFAETVSTTLPGLLAMIIYGGNIVEQDAEAFADSNCPFIQTLATAAKAIAQVQS
jgi:hypothetical protein